MYTLEEISNYIKSQPNYGHVYWCLTDENIKKANTYILWWKSLDYDEKNHKIKLYYGDSFTLDDIYDEHIKEMYELTHK